MQQVLEERSQSMWVLPGAVLVLAALTLSACVLPYLGSEDNLHGALKDEYVLLFLPEVIPVVGESGTNQPTRHHDQLIAVEGLYRHFRGERERASRWRIGNSRRASITAGP